jgi:hypothetical protein
MMDAVRLHTALAGGCVGILASVCFAGSAGPASSPLSLGSCFPPMVAGSPGGPASLGLDSAGAAVPAWASGVGRLSVAVGGTDYGVDGYCVVAIDLASGGVDWTARVNQSPTGFASGVVADGATVLVASDAVVGTCGECPQAWGVDELTAYDSGTGAERWRFALPFMLR